MTAVYDFRPDEVRLLVELCHATDESRLLREALAEQGVVVRGSKGQPRSSPLLASLQSTRLQMIRLTGALALPNEDEDEGKTASARQGQQAARARWAGHVRTRDFRRQDA